jgi:hypothetical protein
MTGDNVSDGISSNSIPYSSTEIGVSHSEGNFFVGCGFSSGNQEKKIPYFELKWRTWYGEGEMWIHSCFRGAQEEVYYWLMEMGVGFCDNGLFPSPLKVGKACLVTLAK